MAKILGEVYGFYSLPLVILSTEILVGNIHIEYLYIAVTKCEFQPQTHRRDSWGATKHQEMKPLHDEFGSERKASYCFEFWRKWRVGADSTKMIDLKSRE